MQKKSEKNIYYSIIDTNQKKEKRNLKSNIINEFLQKKKKGFIIEYIGICSLHVSLHKILGVNRGQKISRYASRSN